MKNVLIFDLETNGFLKSSVLQFSGIKYSYKNGKFNKINEQDFYYLPKEGEEWNYHAYNVHKIKLNEIKKHTDKRIKETLNLYKKHIEKDITLIESINNIKYFNKDKILNKYLEDVDVFVGHNIKSFDMKFMECHLNKQRFHNIFDTMLLTTNELKLTCKGKSNFKKPKLQEACEYYKIKYETYKAHNAKYDVEVNTKLFFEMIKDQKYLSELDNEM
ncbi:MAG: hypothetical protein M0Q88_09685 [Bacilli bacterium]|nr:hypothetical protein [Bacilli bacterium]